MWMLIAWLSKCGLCRRSRQALNCFIYFSFANLLISFWYFWRWPWFWTRHWSRRWQSLLLTPPALSSTPRPGSTIMPGDPSAFYFFHEFFVWAWIEIWLEEWRGLSAAHCCHLHCLQVVAEKRTGDFLVQLETQISGGRYLLSAFPSNLKRGTVILFLKHLIT